MNMTFTKEQKKAWQQEYNKKNRERLNQKAYEWKRKNPEKAKKYQRSSDLKARYGVSLTQYNELFRQQNGNCAICLRNQSEFKLKLAVDHDHKTGKLCKLLCSNCNTALGLLKESPDTALRAVFYLKRFKL